MLPRLTARRVEAQPDGLCSPLYRKSPAIASVTTAASPVVVRLLTLAAAALTVPSLLASASALLAQ